jgi:hypothetical protein
VLGVAWELFGGFRGADTMEGSRCSCPLLEVHE